MTSPIAILWSVCRHASTPYSLTKWTGYTICITKHMDGYRHCLTKYALANHFPHCTPEGITYKFNTKTRECLSMGQQAWSRWHIDFILCLLLSERPKNQNGMCQGTLSFKHLSMPGAKRLWKHHSWTPLMMTYNGGSGFTRLQDFT